MEKPIIFVRMATINDIKYVNEILAEMESSVIERGSDITKCSSASISKKMTEGKAIIVVTSTAEWVGFSYLGVWQDYRVVSNLGLIVSHKFRNSGVVSAIKSRICKLSSRQSLEGKNRNNYLCKAMLSDSAKLASQNAQSKVTEFKIV